MRPRYIFLILFVANAFAAEAFGELHHPALCQYAFGLAVLSLALAFVCMAVDL